MNDTNENNPLGYEKLSVLLKRFAIPSIIAMVVSSLYNIVDQIFIGQGDVYKRQAVYFSRNDFLDMCLHQTVIINKDQFAGQDIKCKAHVLFMLPFYRNMKGSDVYKRQL